MTSRSSPQVHLRLPEALKDRLTEAADEAHRSINSEIVARLETSFDAFDIPPLIMERVKSGARQSGRTVSEEMAFVLSRGLNPFGLPTQTAPPSPPKKSPDAERMARLEATVAKLSEIVVSMQAKPKRTGK